MYKKPAKREPRKPKKISKTYLENATLYYLERYATSAANLRRVLLRKVKRSCDFHKLDASEFTDMVDELIKRYVEVGLVDDISYALARVNSFRRKGLGRQAIISKLRIKGLSIEQIETAMAEVDEEHEEPELVAALAYIKRKKLGPYRTKPFSDDPTKDKQKELASLARAGFSYEICQKALNVDIDDLI